MLAQRRLQFREPREFLSRGKTAPALAQEALLVCLQRFRLLQALRGFLQRLAVLLHLRRQGMLLGLLGGQRVGRLLQALLPCVVLRADPFQRAEQFGSFGRCLRLFRAVGCQLRQEGILSLSAVLLLL